MLKRLITLGIGFAALLCAVLSARLGIPVIAYGVVVATVLSMILCAWGGLDSKATPYLVFLLALAFLYQTTLITNNLIGTDINTEYYFYQKTLLHGWNPAFPDVYNTAVGSSLIAPAITKFLHIPGYWIYKVIFPFLFAFVPVILYQIYKQEFKDKVAFLACVLTVTLPTYLLEMTGLPRQQLGELMLALCLLMIAIRPMMMRWLVVWLVVCGSLAYLFHYVMGPIVLTFSMGMIATLLVIRILGKWWKSPPPVKFPVKWLVVCTIIPAIIGFTYYTNVAGGAVSRDLISTAKWAYDGAVSAFGGHGAPVQPPIAQQPITTTGTTVTESPLHYLTHQEPVILTALGLDFNNTDVLGKVFRVFQLLIEISLLLGCIWLLLARKKPSAEYIGITVVGIVMLAACVVLPRLSNIINATRVYQLALFGLAPIIVIGATVIFRNLKVVVVTLLVPYVILTTGATFELVHETNISAVTAPYSIALSNYRIHATGAYTDGDADVAKWIELNNVQPVLTDIGGMLLLSQGEDPYNYIVWIAASTSPLLPQDDRYYTVQPTISDEIGQPAGNIDHGWGYLPHDVTTLPKTAYIFLTSQDMENGTVTFKPNWFHLTNTESGMRQQYPFADLKLNLDDYRIVYQSGTAIVITEK